LQHFYAPLGALGSRPHSAMIFVRLKGGIGNQMFQYALARHIALRQGSEVVIDTRHYRRMKYRYLKYRLLGRDISLIYRAYNLEDFNIKARLITGKECRKMALKKEGKLFSSPTVQVINEPEDYFWDENILKSQEDLYLTGHWQRIEYIRDIQAQLKEDFTPKAPLDPANQARLERIQEKNSIAVHVRLGDFRRFGRALTPKEYYLEAMQYFSGKVENPYFVFFSDEPEWVEENLHGDFPMEIVSGNTLKNSFKDLVLMSQCKHNIISNSTFSWWGAWLNPHENAEVLYPTAWTTNPNFKLEYLIPSHWKGL